MIRIELLLLVSAAVLILSIVLSKAAVRSGIPTLLLFLALGMLAGSDGPGGIYFDNPWLAQLVGVVALAFILFAGGLDTNWRNVRPVLWQGLRLATLGVLITAMLMGVFVSQILGFSPLEGILLGAIISSTDAAAVFAVLRARAVRLKGQLRPLLELESGSNDPMAVFLTIGMIQLITNPGQSALDLVPLFVMQMGIGGVFGLALGRLAATVINTIRLEYDGLYSVLTIALVMLSYGGAAALGGNGFLAVYLTGLVLGNMRFIHKGSLLRFHDGVAWLMQIAMFLTLGLQVYPSRLLTIIPAGLIIAAFLIVVARPVSVFAALAFAPLTLREKLLVAWVGLRGAAPIVLATFPLLAGLPKAEIIFNLVFFIVLTSVLLQGTLIIPVARWLRVDSPEPTQLQSPLAFVMDDGQIADDLVEFSLPANCGVIGKRILDLSLPEGSLIVLIGRQNTTIVPNGGTVLEANDTLLVLARKDVQPTIKALLQSPKAE